MTRGLWIVVGILLLQGLFYAVYEYDFLDQNVWTHHDIQNADEITRETDFLAVRVVSYVSRSVSAAFTGLIVFLKLALYTFGSIYLRKPHIRALFQNTNKPQLLSPAV